MPFASGVAAQLGFKGESVFGTQVTVDKCIDFLGYDLALEQRWAVGEGLYSNGQYPRLSRTVQTTRNAAGSMEACVTSRYWGTLLKHMLGSSITTPTLIAGTAYKQVHQVGSTDGMSLTWQVGYPQVSDGTVKPFTHVGTKVGGFTLSCERDDFLKANLDMVAKDELTLVTSPASNALTAASYVTNEGFTWNQCVVKIGGTVSGTTELSVSGGVTVASVLNGFELAHTNNMNTEGYGTASTMSREPKSKRAQTVLTLEPEFGTQAEFYDVYRAGTSTAVQITFTGSIISGAETNKVDIILPGTKLRSAPVGLNDDDLAGQSVELEVGYNGSQAGMQITYQSTDSTAL